MAIAARPFWVRVHRWAGLATALFLCVAGLTGSILAFKEDLDAWLNPQLFLAPAEGRALLDPFVLRDTVRAQLPWAGVEQVPLRREAGRAVVFRLTPRQDTATGRMLPLPATHAFADPYSGKVLGWRNEGAVSLARENLLPFIYRLHLDLTLPGVWGRLLYGVIALIWTLDCFVGFYLTLPSKGAKRTGFWRAWRPAWSIKRGASAARVTLDLHRAFGLWLWALLLVYAWSSVMFNLRAQVYQPVMSVIMPFDTSWRGAPVLPQPLATPALEGPAALEAARRAMGELEKERGFTVDGEESLMLDRRRGVYAYLAHSDADLRRHVGNTAILIDANTGERRGMYLPTRGAWGDTFSNWLGALHMAHVFGLPYRIFACLLGLIVVLLSVTGVLIWRRKQRGRSHAALRRPG
ncbi:PepSY-associated TM helix domain-containing protein [Achromobacter mucicolens]|uniref:PepSY-associated TM helix domain-containing protein n=1 Tax=Achromobacter mucicolens TaxID=1389922 RepID=UPI0022F3AD96|nr:PepSY-associated TM helix domain-containing protein [Achromobacter mucicolens]WBX86947.1 PepSY-associated TM helix domain-containing protein [Achromobacter mucicolens]